MAKQRRARPRPAPKKTKKTSVRPRAMGAAAPPVLRSQEPPGTSVRAPVPPPAPRTTYIEAVALYERGLQAVQAHDYNGAADLLRSVLARYPEEKELHERVRLYLNICERQITPKQAGMPRSAAERLYAATLALNAGDYQQALSHLESVLGEQPDNDHAHYVRAVALTLTSDFSSALSSLTRAIELNPENRALAIHDPDLDTLRGEDGFRPAIDALWNSLRQDRRRNASRGRFSR